MYNTLLNIYIILKISKLFVPLLLSIRFPFYLYFFLIIIVCLDLFWIDLFSDSNCALPVVCLNSHSLLNMPAGDSVRSWKAVFEFRAIPLIGSISFLCTPLFSRHCITPRHCDLRLFTLL